MLPLEVMSRVEDTSIRCGFLGAGQYSNDGMDPESRDSSGIDIVAVADIM